MYGNLKAEMARKNIKVKDIAALIGTTGACASAKINNSGRIKLDEAILIRDTYFPDMDLKMLFANC